MKRYSDDELATIAEELRRRLNLLPSDKVNVLALVDRFQRITDPKWKIRFVESPASYMRQALARAEPTSRTVHYTRDLMNRLVKGDAKAALVFLEEIFHVLLRHDARVLNHSIGRDVRANAMPELDAMEQEAEHAVCFFLAPFSELYSVGSAEEIMKRYDLPQDVAEKYHHHIKRRRNRDNGRRRDLPEEVIDLLFEMRKRYPKSDTNPIAKSPAPQKVLPSFLPETEQNGFLAQICDNCGVRAVAVIGRCKQCRNCGDEDGCN